MKTNMKKLAAWMLALLLVFQIVPVMASQVVEGAITISGTQEPIGEDNYREKLQIKSDTSIITVNGEAHLTASEGYNELTWTCNPEGIVSIDNGLVTGLQEGKVRITAAEGDFKDSIILKVVGYTAPATESTDLDEFEEPAADTTKIIAININKRDKVTYNGKPQKFEYTVEGRFDGFDSSKVQITDPDLLLTGKDCGVYQTKFESLEGNYFTYDGQTEGYEFVVSDGWMKIIPAEVTIKAEDQVRTFDDPKAIPNPVTPEVTVTGVVEGETIKYKIQKSTIDGIIYYIPEVTSDEAITKNYKITIISGKVFNDAPLYNIMEVEGTYYRLAKTRILTPKDLKLHLGVSIEPYYETEDYDFSDIVVTDKKSNKYIYRCAKNAKAIAEGANYYTVSLVSVKGIKNKIGAMTGNVPNWLVGENEQYSDSNGRDSYHRDFKATLVLNDKTNKTQDLYNELSINGEGNYYKLKMTSITAKPFGGLQHATVLKSDEYYMEPYDFSNLVLEIDGKEYKYSDHVIEGEHDFYYTVKLSQVIKEDRINQNASWFAKREGWLDGSYEQYGNLPNETPGYHANYIATTYESNKQFDESKLAVILHSNLEGMNEVKAGTEVVLTAEPVGFEGIRYDIEWEYEKPDGSRVKIEGADSLVYKFQIDSEKAQYVYHVILTPTGLEE